MILISKWYTDAGTTHLCLFGSAQLTLSHERIGGTQEYVRSPFCKTIDSLYSELFSFVYDLDPYCFMK